MRTFRTMADVIGGYRCGSVERGKLASILSACGPVLCEGKVYAAVGDGMVERFRRKNERVTPAVHVPAPVEFQGPTGP
jgi:hypothetical protein